MGGGQSGQPIGCVSAAPAQQPRKQNPERGPLGFSPYKGPSSPPPSLFCMGVDSIHPGVVTWLEPTRRGPPRGQPVAPTPFTSLTSPTLLRPLVPTLGPFSGPSVFVETSLLHGLCPGGLCSWGPSLTTPATWHSLLPSLLIPPEHTSPVDTPSNLHSCVVYLPYRMWTQPGAPGPDSRPEVPGPWKLGSPGAEFISLCHTTRFRAC